LLSRILADLDVDVVQAQDGKIALEKLNSEGPFDFALVDWEMPVLNGIGFVEEARKTFPTEKMKMIMVTSVNDIDHVVEALLKGADEYVMKPFSKESLMEKLAIVGIDLSV